MKLHLYAQTPAATTGPKGITARLALIRNTAEAANTTGKIAFLILPSSRHAALGRGNGGIGSTIQARRRGWSAGSRHRHHRTEPGSHSPECAGRRDHAGAGCDHGSKGFTAICRGRCCRRRSHLHARRRRRATQQYKRHWQNGTRRALDCDLDARTGWFSCVGERGTGTSVFLNSRIGR